MNLHFPKIYISIYQDISISSFHTMTYKTNTNMHPFFYNVKLLDELFFQIEAMYTN